MHASVMTWLAEHDDLKIVRPEFRNADILEVGSYNENGSARSIFQDGAASYIGVDMRAGRDVDLVMNADSLMFESASFDLVICTEMLEHDQRPWKSIPEMWRVLRPGGSLLLTARGFDEYQGCYGRHDCPGDFWRFNPNSFNVLIRDAGLQPVQIMSDPEVPGVFAHAVKP